MTCRPPCEAPRGVAIRGTRYPVVLPSVRDPRLHLAAVIVSLQVLGQVAFDFRLSIAQILISVVTCAVLEVAIVLRRQRALVWPASALLTGNGVAFILRVPGTEHGDWWSTNGWWIFAGTAAISLLSKYLIRFRGAHVFNPSNFGLVLCFLVLGPERADPLDFWWGPMSPALALALAIIVVGGFAILSRLRLLAMAFSFWLVFVTAVAVVAVTGHAMTARWHLGPVEGFHFWTDPRLLTGDPRVPLLHAHRSEDGSGREGAACGVRPLGGVARGAPRRAFARRSSGRRSRSSRALAVVCAARPLAAILPSIRPGRRRRRRAGGRGSRDVLRCVWWSPARAPDRMPWPRSLRRRSPGFRGSSIRASKGVDSTLDRRTAVQIAADLQTRRPGLRLRRVALWLEAAVGSVPVDRCSPRGQVREQTVEVALSPSGYRVARIRE